MPSYPTANRNIGASIGGYADAQVPVRPPSMLQTANAHIEECLNRLSTRVQNLQERLETVLRPSGPQSGECGQDNLKPLPMPSRTVLESQQRASQLESLVAQVDDILERLEV